MQKDNSPIVKLLANLLTLVFSLYMITVCLAGAYFNWQFAKANGFVNWLLFGEIVPTMKATVWPYYAFKNAPPEGRTSTSVAKPLTNAQVASMELKKMIDALNYSQQATVLINTGHTDSSIRHYTNIEKIVEYRRLAYEAGQKTNVEVLNGVFPELGTRFRDGFLKFLDTFLRGYESDSDELVRSADKLNDQWADWYQANQKAIQAASDRALGY